MTILFVTPYFSRRGEKLKGGGLEVYLRRVTESLYRLGHSPIILSLGTKEMHYIEDGTEVFFVRCVYKQFGKGSLNLMYEMVYKSCIINNTIDILQVPSPYSPSLCYYGKIPSVMRLSSYSKIYNNNEEFGKEKITIWGMCERLAARRCNAVFAPSNVVADIFSHDIHRPVSVIESPFLNEYHVLDNSFYQQNLYDKKYFLFLAD